MLFSSRFTPLHKMLHYRLMVNCLARRVVEDNLGIQSSLIRLFLSHFAHTPLHLLEQVTHHFFAPILQNKLQAMMKRYGQRQTQIQASSSHHLPSYTRTEQVTRGGVLDYATIPSPFILDAYPSTPAISVNRTTQRSGPEKPHDGRASSVPAAVISTEISRMEMDSGVRGCGEDIRDVINTQSLSPE